MMRLRRDKENKDKFTEDRIQQGLRILYRDQQGQSASGPLRLHTQTDPCKRRTLHHTCTERVRREDVDRRRTDVPP